MTDLAPQTKLRTFRDAIREIVPVWLRGRVGGGILFAIASQLDALADATVGAVKSRFPGVYGFESLAPLGRERRIRRGRDESDATYAARMALWLDDHRRRGGPYALLSQLAAHYASAPFPIDLVYRSGRRFRMDAAGAITRDDDLGTALNTEWAHWTLFYHWPYAGDDDGTWGDPGTWEDGGVWDSTLTPSDVTDIRLIPKEWNAAHCFGRVILLTVDSDYWDYPDGTWDEPGGFWYVDTIGSIELSIG